MKREKLAERSGTRLNSLTLVLSKHVITTFDKPLLDLFHCENKFQLFVSRSFKRAFLFLFRNATFAHKIDNISASKSEQAIMWNKIDLNIKWGDKNSDFYILEK